LQAKLTVLCHDFTHQALMDRAVVCATDGHEVVERSRAAIFATPAVMAVEMSRGSTALHTTAILVAPEHHPARRRRDVLRRALRRGVVEAADTLRVAFDNVEQR